MATTDTERLVSKIDDLIRSLEGEKPDEREKRHQSETAQIEKDEVKKQNKELLKELESYGKTEKELLIKKYKEQLELIEGDFEARKKLRKKYSDELNKLEEQKNKELLEEKKSQMNEELALMEESGASAMQILNARIAQERELYEEGSRERLLAEAKYNKAMREARMGAINNLISAVQSVVNVAQERLDDIMNSWGKADQAAHTFGRSVGLTSDKIDKLRSNTLDFLSGFNSIAGQYNINTEELLALQGDYLKGLGRAISLNEANLENMISMRNVMGEASSIKFSVNLDKFGIDVDAAGEMASEMYAEVGNKGLVFSEVSESFLNNIELAQQYTFKDGIEGLKRMTEQAVAVKWNMQQTAAFAEKVGSIEGAVTTGAQLSVLGGPFAQFSNPMGMLYESLNDMEGLQSRMIGMFENLGSWNNETGQFEVSAFNRMRIKSASQAMGLNYGDVMNNVFSSARRGKIKDSIEGLGLDSNTMELIMNTGQIDKNGQAYVNITDEKTGKVRRKNITQDGLSEDEIKILKKDANNEAQDIKDIAKATMSTSETVEGIKKEVEANKAYMYDLSSPEGWVPKLAATVEYSKEALNQITMILHTIQALIGVSSAIGSMRGFGGQSGKGGFMSSSYAKMTNVGAAKSISGKIGRGALKTVGTAGRVIGSPIGAVAAYGGSMLLNNQANKLAQEGNYDDAMNVSKASSALSWGATGAMTLGSILPGWGHLIGGVGGAVAGWLMGGSEIEEQKKAAEEAKEEQEKIERRRKLDNYLSSNYGLALNGEYTDDDVKMISKGRSALSPTLEHNMKIYDSQVLYSLPETLELAKGGLLNGPSHESGGIPVAGTNLELEGGEYVVNKYSTQKFLPLLDFFNNYPKQKMGEGGFIQKPLEPMGEQLNVFSKNSNTNHQVSFDSLKTDISGTIKLDLGGYNKDIDGKELLNNHNFIGKIRDILMVEMNMVSDKSFNPNNHYRKWGYM